MPRDSILNEFMKSTKDLAYRLANHVESVYHTRREERIKFALKEAYLAGYV